MQLKAANASPIGHSLKFDFGDEKVLIDGTLHTNVVSFEDRPADCTITVSKEDFLALSKGELNPMSAVMSGKVKIDGDMSVAMKLQTLFA